VDFSTMQERALSVRQRYEAHERDRNGRPWSLEELTLGLVGDIGDLAKLIQANEGVRESRTSSLLSATSLPTSCGR
jgi:hypothetical protein